MRKINAPVTSKEGEKAHEARPAGPVYTVSKAAPLGGAALILGEHMRMAGKKHSPEDIVAKLRQVEARRSKGQTCAEAVRSIGVSEVTYRRWLAEFGGLIRTLRSPSD